MIWTDEQKKHLKDLYPNFTQKQIAALLGCTISGVKGKATVWKIRKRKRGVTDEEKKFMAEHWNILTKKEIAKKLGRSPQAIFKTYKKFVECKDPPGE